MLSQEQQHLDLGVFCHEQRCLHWYLKTTRNKQQRMSRRMWSAYEKGTNAANQENEEYGRLEDQETQ